MILLAAILITAPAPAALASSPVTSPASAQAAAPTGAQAAEKPICKTTSPAGSRTRKIRICLTPAEWRRQVDNARSDTKGLQERSVPRIDR